MSVVSGVSRSTSPFSTISSVSQLPIGNVTESVHKILTERECGIFDKGLSTYHKRRDVSAFVECLAMVLNTNRKRQLLVPIRDSFVKPSDVLKFNSLAIRHGLAAPLGATGTKRERPFSGARKVDVKRTPTGEWGFNVRGGSEHATGVFVSWVEPMSNAHKAGLQIGDQIHKANDTNFDGITHFDATQILKGCKKLRLWVTSHGQIPGIQYANHSYNWVDSRGQPTSPPPARYQPFQLGHSHSDPTERKVSLMVGQGMELGLSIRGGAEHELGIYVTAVDPGSVADAYGIKVGDQILEINGVSFLNITHSDAAKVLRADRHMVLRLKDVGKVPRSKFTAIGRTNWQRSPSFPEPNNHTHNTMSLGRDHSANKQSPDGIVATAPVFFHGAGSQVMLTKTSSPARGIMNDTAKMVLSASEMSTFEYYINQYETGHIAIEDFTTALLQLLNTNQKMQLIAEVRNFIQPQDLDLFNEMTIHQEIIARKALKQKHRSTSSASSTGQMAMAADDSEDELDSIPQRLTSSPRHNHVFLGSTSTPDEDDLASAMRERRGIVGESMATNDSWEETDLGSPFKTGSESLQQKMKELEERTRREVEENLRRETELKLKEQFELEQQRLLLEKSHEIEEKQRKKYIAEKEALEKRLKSLQEQERSKMEATVRQEAEERIREELEEEIRKESEKHFHQEYTDRLQQELRKHKRQIEAEKRRREEEDKRKRELERLRLEAEEQERLEMEERIRKEAEEFVKQKYEAQLLRESREKARLAEEVKTYRQIEGKLKDEQTKREQLEYAKKEAEQKARKEAAEKEELQALLKEREEEMEAELAARDEAEQQRHREQERRRREEERRRREKERARMDKERKWREEKEREMEERMQREEREEEKERQRQAEEKQKLDKQKKQEEKQKEEERIRRDKEERIRKDKEERIRRDKEERIKREEEERIKREEEERIKREEERIRREEEKRIRREEEARQRQKEQEEKLQKEERQREEERHRQESEMRHREEEIQRQDAIRKEEEEQQRLLEEEEEQQRLLEEEEMQRREAEEEIQRMHEEEQRRLQQAEERRRKEDHKREQRERARQASDEKHRRDVERAQARQAEEERLRRLREEQEVQKQMQLEKRLQEEQRRYEEEQRRILAEERRVSVEDQQFDAAAMDALVLELATEIPPPSAVQPITSIRNKPRSSPRVSFENGPKSNSQIIEEERLKAEKMLAERVRRENQRQLLKPPPQTEGGKSYAGYTGLKGRILTVNVTKVTRKLGIAVDGGSNTKQKAVIIRQITPDGSAGLTGIGLETDQQILAINGKSLKGLKHKEAVFAIKTAFEGPINKVIEFVVLDPIVDED